MNQLYVILEIFEQQNGPHLLYIGGSDQLDIAIDLIAQARRNNPNRSYRMMSTLL